MSYNEGIFVGGKHSFRDFGLVLADRQIGFPKKNSIRKSVPYRNGYYDFTKLYGAPTFSERQLVYSFDVIGFTVAEMEAEREKVVNWLCNVHNQEIRDDAFPGYRFKGSFDSMSVTEGGEQSTLTFTFVCYPFKISDASEGHTSTKSETFTATNNGQPVMVRMTTTASCTVTVGGASYGVAANVSGQNVFELPSGTTSISISISGGTANFFWNEELI